MFSNGLTCNDHITSMENQNNEMFDDGYENISNGDLHSVESPAAAAVTLPQRKEKQPSAMVLFAGTLKEIWNTKQPTFKKLLPSLILAVFSGSAAVGFYYLEKEGACPMPDYWVALFFVGTIHSTIGYGNIAPCTVGGKLATVVYTLISIPLTLTALDGLGYLLARFSASMWNKITSALRRCYRLCKERRRDKVSPEGSVRIDDSRSEQSFGFPFVLSLLLTIQWLFLSALFFALTEEWTYFDAMYFVFISITTIGFGDIDPKSYYLCIVQWAFIMIGLALFSMSINVMQENMENMSKNISNWIAKQYLENLQAGTQMGDEGADEAAVRANIRRVIKRQPGGRYLQLFIGKGTEERLVSEFQKRANMRVATTQTEVQTKSFGQMYRASMLHQETQNSGSRGHVHMKSASSQINWMPVYHGNRAPHWTEVFSASIKPPKLSPKPIRPPPTKPKPKAGGGLLSRSSNQSASTGNLSSSLATSTAKRRSGSVRIPSAPNNNTLQKLFQKRSISR